jgi:hypothetical protein
MATILGDVTLVITPTLEPAGDQVAKILGRDDLENIHVMHLNDTETPEEWKHFLKTALKEHYSDLRFDSSKKTQKIIDNCAGTGRSSLFSIDMFRFCIAFGVISFARRLSFRGCYVPLLRKASFRVMKVRCEQTNCTALSSGMILVLER